MKDLRNLAAHAKKILKEKNLNHVVYGYIMKGHSYEIHLIDWTPLEFKTDEEFDNYIKLAESNVEMIYAVHA